MEQQKPENNTAVATAQANAAALKKPEQVHEVVKAELARKANEFMVALGDARKVERYKALLLVQIYRNPELAKCEPASIVASALEAAQFGLEFGPKQHSYLVPYGGKCTFMPGWRGLIHAAKRGGDIKEIYAQAVYDGDQFHYTLGLDRTLAHEPALKAQGTLTHVYAVVKFANGSEPDMEVMTKAQVDNIKKKSKMQNGAWATDYDEMAKKTVIKRICKRLDVSEELATLVSYGDEQYDVEPQPQMAMPQRASVVTEEVTA